MAENKIKMIAGCLALRSQELLTKINNCCVEIEDSLMFDNLYFSLSLVNNHIYRFEQFEREREKNAEEKK